MGNKILLIHTNKVSGAYVRYESYTLTKTLTKELLLCAVEAHNNNEEKDTVVKIYEDDLLVALVDDVRALYSHKNLIDSLKSITEDIDDSICDLESWRDEISDLLAKTEEKDNDR